MNNREFKENLFTIGVVTIVIILCLVSVPKLILGKNINIDEEQGTATKTSSKTSSKYININGDDEVKVYRSKTGKVEKLNIEDYIIGVVSGEMPVKFEMEALKAQAIAARTYYFAKKDQGCDIAKGADICDTIHCQVYMNKSERKNQWDKKVADKNYKKIEEAVKDTAGLVLSYDEEIIKYPQFFSTSWGKTENSEDVFVSAVPYLKSTESPGEEVSPSYAETKKFSNNEFVNLVNFNLGVGLTNGNLKSKIQITERTEGGGVKKIKIAGKEVKGTEFRKALDLNSTNFEINYFENSIEIKSKGNGHGVGMSQWGANLMAKDGENYEEILKHYYKGIEIKKIKFK